MLQRSVTLIRRLSCRRPKVSVSGLAIKEETLFPNVTSNRCPSSLPLALSLLFPWRPVVTRFTILLSTIVGCANLTAQINVLTCVPSGNPPLVRVEGLTERIGDIQLACSGGAPSAQ